MTSDLTSLELPKPSRLNFELFQEIAENLDKIKNREAETKRDRLRIEKSNDAIKLALDTFSKAESKRDSLLKKNRFLKDTLEETANRTNQALNYWKEYGLDIKEISTNHYEFIYTKLNVSVGVKFEDRQLKVVSQDPEVLTSDTLTELNSRLTNTCVHSDGTNDYKLAMITIKKELMKKNPSTT